jgi:predicted SprT family Zn-dependent metalloprotease
MVKLSPQKLAGIYEMLCQFEPFKGWTMPPSKDIEFHVSRDKTCYGEYSPEPHAITLSSAKNGFLETAIRTMAHEMIHLKLYVLKRKNWDKHESNFAQMAHKVSVNMGFDPKEL